MPPLRVVFYAASAAGVYMLGHAWFIAPPPLSWAMAALIGYVALVTAGIFFSNASMFVDVITRGPQSGDGVALSFDDGPDPDTTPQVLATLRRYQAKASFFVIGKKAEKHPELVQAILADGHTLGLHSYAHDRLFALRSAKRIREDLQRAGDVIESICGARPRLFRAPIGHISPAMGRVIAELELQTVGWSLRGYDGLASATPQKVAQRIGPKLSDGAIVLLHDAAERGDFRPASLAALPKILDAAERNNLRLVPLSDWLGDEHRLVATDEAVPDARTRDEDAATDDDEQDEASEAREDAVDANAPDDAPADEA